MFTAARRLVRASRAASSGTRRSWWPESTADRSPLSLVLVPSVLRGGARRAVPPSPVGLQACPDEAAHEHDSG
jgi:hypothetical protein